MPKHGTAKELVGRPVRRTAIMVNPAPKRADGMLALVMTVTKYLLPLLVSGALGALEALARKGEADWWKVVPDGIKCAIFAAIAGAAEYAINDDPGMAPDVRSLLDRVYGMASSMFGFYGGHRVLSDGDMHEAKAAAPTPAKVCPPGTPPDDCKGLGALTAARQRALQLADKDAADAEAAVHEMVRRRAEWESGGGGAGVGEIPIQGAEYGEPDALGEIPIQGVQRVKLI